MNEFAKTKIIFSVALLAALYTVNPVVLKFAEVGATVLGFTISMKLVYYLILACLGLSVYFYSVQFISEKKIKYVQEAGDILYGIALAMPPAFLSLVLAIKAIDLMGKEELSKILSPLISAIVGVLTSLLSAKFKRKITTMRRASEAKVEEESEHEYLSRAIKLFDDKYFDLCILETFKAVESALNRQLLSMGEQIEPGRFFANFQKAKKLEIITLTDMQSIENLKKIRNQVAHEKTEIKEGQARELLRQGEKIIVSLSRLSPPQTGIRSFDWLMKNYGQAIAILRGKRAGKPSDVLRKTIDAWNNRDGAIGSEISTFFAEALINRPEIVIDLLKEIDDFDEWLNFMPRDILTDWRGTEEEVLVGLRGAIVESIQSYVARERNGDKRSIAEKILRAFIHAEIRKIY